MRFDALLLAAALAVAAPQGRADEAAAPPVAKADHVDMVVSGKPLTN